MKHSAALSDLPVDSLVTLCKTQDLDVYATELLKRLEIALSIICADKKEHNTTKRAS